MKCLFIWMTRLPGLVAVLTLAVLEVSCERPADVREAAPLEGFRSMEEQPLEVALIAETTAVRPGQTFYAGIHLQPEQGFHTYWKHPGVVGIATAIEWQLPDGWEAGAIEWPAPEVVMMGPYPAHGYKGEVLLPVSIRVPEDAPAGPLVLRGDARWMCCADTCHPGFRALEVEVRVLPRGEEPPGDVHENTRQLFERAKAAQPQKPRGFEFSAERDATGVTVVIRPGGEPGVDATPLVDLTALRFYCDQGIVSSDREQEIEIHEDGGLRLRLVTSPFGPQDASQLSGVFEARAGWFMDQQGQPVRHIEVAMPLPPAPTL